MLLAYAKITLDRRRCSTPTLPDEPWFGGALRALLPDAAARAVRRPARRPPAAPRDHHHRAGQRPGQPGRHHLRVPAAVEETGASRGGGGPGVRGGPRGLRARATLGRASRRWTTRSRPASQTAALPRDPPAARPRDPLAAAAAGGPASTSPPRSSTSARPWTSWCRRCPSCWSAPSGSGCTLRAAEFAGLGRARRPRRAGGRAARRVLAARRRRDRGGRRSVPADEVARRLLRALRAVSRSTGC